MNLHLSKKIVIVFLSFASLAEIGFAAKIEILSPEKALANRQAVPVQVFLDTEGETVSGISGSFSFPSELFSVESIVTEGSVVSLWILQPKVSDERYLDGRTHITFEGIFPGGYSGVRSAYHEGPRPGIVFYAMLTPKQKGTGTLLIDDITLNSFSSDASPIKTETSIKTIVVPELVKQDVPEQIGLRRVENSTLNAFITRNELINRNAWYLVVNQREQVNSIEQIYIAESSTYNSELLRDMEWRSASSPYVLLHQDRTKYVHVKVVYSNNTYTMRTLPPVENPHSISLLSRILISILALLAVAYLYGKHLINAIKAKIG